MPNQWEACREACAKVAETTMPGFVGLSQNIAAAIRALEPPPVPQSHDYMPDPMAMGDCRICGRTEKEHGVEPPVPQPSADAPSADAMEEARTLLEKLYVLWGVDVTYIDDPFQGRDHLVAIAAALKAHAAAKDAKIAELRQHQFRTAGYLELAEMRARTAKARVAVLTDKIIEALGAVLEGGGFSSEKARRILRAALAGTGSAEGGG